MTLKPKNIELQNKIIGGASKAYQKLVIASAGKDEKLVIADKDGNECMFLPMNY